MAEIDRIVVHGIVVEEDASFTLDSLCRACGAERAQVLALVGEGVLDPVGAAPELWLFDGPALRTTRTALRLKRSPFCRKGPPKLWFSRQSRRSKRASQSTPRVG